MSASVIVKFRRRTRSSSGIRRIEQVLGDQLELARALFPDDRDLSSLFELSIVDGSEIDKVIELLEAMADVEHAHRPSPRAPARR